MRMLLVFIFLLIPVTLYATNPCDGVNSSTCEATNGCYWANECRQCDPGKYCEGGTNSPTSCSDATHGLFPDSDEGSDDITDCYESVDCENGTTGAIDSTCKVQNSDSTPTYTPNTSYNELGFFITCGEETQDSGTYHIEIYNNDLVCLDQRRNCEKFANSCDGGTVTGTATYGTEWNISSCVCEKVFSNTSDRHCDGIERFNASPNSVQYFFNPINFGGNSSYYCNKCQDEYYVKQTGGSCSTTPPGTATMVVCKCKEKIPKGFYADPSECTWNASSLSDTPCQPHPCPPGQTTPNDGTMNASLCTYAPNTSSTPTQFCDAKGCFTLSSTDIGAWDFNH